ncbi:hypothetical protein ACFE04_009003 [Oxalis oulophora]
MSGEGDSISLDIKCMADMLNEKLNTNLNMPPECCIFQTPKILSRHNKKAYIPNGFAIGPFHHRKTPILKATEKIKLKYLRGILNRSSTSREEKLQELLKAVSQVQEHARKCYAGLVEYYDSKTFVEMLVVDGCFIIELFRKDYDDSQKEPDDPIFTMSCLLENLNHDLILMENQVPWLVLEILFNLTMIRDEKPLDHLAIKFFGNIFTSNIPDTDKLPWDKIRRAKSKHILDLLRNFLIVTSQDTIDPKTTSGWIALPSASVLNQLGVKFVQVSPMSILDIHFNNGCLEIPSILLQETTETIFRNLISLEQCVPNYSPRVTSYVKLMVNLIDTKEDIKILCKNKIVDNWVNLEESTKIFNHLYADTYVKEFHYSKLCSNVVRFQKKRLPEFKYLLFHNYCFNPWATVATCVVSFAFILTIISTVCDIKQAWIPGAPPAHAPPPPKI